MTAPAADPVGQVCNLPSPRARSGRLQVCPTVVAIIACAVGGLVRGDEPVPVAPLRADVVIDPAVVPAAVELGGPRSGALPLAGSPAGGKPAAGPAAPVGPAGEWTVLAAIVAAFGILAAYRFQQSRRTARGLPPDVYELLGEASLGGQHGVRIVRFGPRTLLVSVSPAGCQALASLEDPAATERIVAACLGARQPERAARARRPAGQAPARGGSTGGEAT